jgi:hypothetical protein
MMKFFLVAIACSSCFLGCLSYLQTGYELWINMLELGVTISNLFAAALFSALSLGPY